MKAFRSHVMIELPCVMNILMGIDLRLQKKNCCAFYAVILKWYNQIKKSLFDSMKRLKWLAPTLYVINKNYRNPRHYLSNRTNIAVERDSDCDCYCERIRQTLLFICIHLINKAFSYSYFVCSFKFLLLDLSTLRKI